MKAKKKIKKQEQRDPARERNYKFSADIKQESGQIEIQRRHTK